jgi:RHS repeat-associated protein
MQTGPDFTNPSAVASRTIAYNADNMPLSIVHNGAVTTSFVYDSAGAPAKKTVSSGAVTYYIGDHYEIKDGAAVKYIFAGSRRVAKIIGNTVYYFHKDHLGSSTVMTDAGAGQVEYSDYLPFGGQREHAGTSVSSYKYTDQELDPSTGFYNYDARLYDPVVGRFVSADSIVPNWYDSQALNRYAYARNNPLLFIDPNGHDYNSWYEANFQIVSDGNPNHYYVDRMKYLNANEHGLVQAAIQNQVLAPVNNFVAGSINEFLRIQQNGPQSELDILAVMSMNPEVGVAIQNAAKGVTVHASNAFKILKASEKLHIISGPMAGRRIGHTFTKHGSHNTAELIKYAKGSGQPVGQWIDDVAAEKFIAEHLDDLSQGAKTFDLPEGIGRIIHPDGTMTPATKARLVPSKTGVKTAFPES